MKNTSSLLMLLLLLLMSLPGISTDPAKAQVCLAHMTILGADDVATITFERPETTGIIVYMHREPGFKGVSLEVEAPDGGDVHDAWFPLDDKCFQGNNSDWWQMGARAEINNQTRHVLTFIVWVGRCEYKCNKAVTFSSGPSLRLKGYGTSGWRLGHPGLNCSVTGIWKRTMMLKLPACRTPPPHGSLSDYTTTGHPPRPATSTDPATPTDSATNTEPTPSTVSAGSVASVVTAIVVCVVAVTMVVIVRVRRRRRNEATIVDETGRPQNTETLDNQHVADRSLQEYFSQYSQIALLDDD